MSIEERRRDMPIPAQAEFLTSEEGAERLSVSEDSVIGYLKAGSLRGFRIGMEWRILSEDLERFTQSQPEDLRLFPLTVGMRRGKRTLHVTRGEID